MIAIIYYNFSYGNYPEKSSHHHQHQHSPHQQSHLSPEKQTMLNNYQKRLDALYHRENNPSYATSGFLTGAVVFGIILIAGIYNNNGPAKAGGMLGSGGCCAGALIAGISASTDQHTNQQEIEKILEKMEKLQK